MGDKSSALIFLVYAMLNSARNNLYVLFLLFFPSLSINLEAPRHRKGLCLQCCQGEGKCKILADLLRMEEQKGDTGTESRGTPALC